MTLDPTTLVDLVLVAFGAEILFLAFGRARFPRLPALRSLWPDLAAGLFLILALRLAVSAAPVGGIAVLLAAAGVAHVVDLLVRSRRR